MHIYLREIALSHMMLTRRTGRLKLRTGRRSYSCVTGEGAHIYGSKGLTSETFTPVRVFVCRFTPKTRHRPLFYSELYHPSTCYDVPMIEKSVCLQLNKYLVNNSLHEPLQSAYKVGPVQRRLFLQSLMTFYYR